MHEEDRHSKSLQNVARIGGIDLRERLASAYEQVDRISDSSPSEVTDFRDNIEERGSLRLGRGEASPENIFTVIPEEPGKEDELVIETYEASTTAFETPRYSKNDKRISKKLESMEIEVTENSRGTGKFGKSDPVISPS